MRLIDADKVIQSIDRQMNMARELLSNKPQAQEFVSIAEQSFKQEISNAPTVKAIPLDKPFCKMVYGDYVVYNKKWLVNHLQTEWNILQGKEYKPAIPVEWIEKYAKRTSKKCCHCATAIWEMLEDWEKENE